MLRICMALIFAGIIFNTFSQIHTTYLWHLQQPIYWPEQSQWNSNQYQAVWESEWLKQNNGNWYSDGHQHPSNNLQDIFNKDDRKAIYQWRAKDAVQSLLGFPEAGAQVNYSGCLMQNVNSLAQAGQWGYSLGWENNFITARNWQTNGGNPRMDVVGFTMHHALSPLLSDEALRKQIQAHQFIYGPIFGTNPNYSKGYWPAECSFSERIIKVLVEEGFDWSVIANSHLARTLADYPLNYGTSGCNIDPPNRADITNFNGNNWWNGQIDGRGGTFAAPFCYQAHKAKYVDPATGVEYIMTVVPMCDLLSYKNGYALMGTGEIDSYIAPYNDPSQPSIVLMAHDGDNAWGGGYDYYTNSVPGFAGAASAKGYVPSTIQQFLNDHPVPANDIVHVEDGSWFNAANDWGHPQFINWLWPMYTQNYEFDPNGWTEDARNWAVIVAAENHVQMAEDLTGGVNIADVVYPSPSSSLAEKAWHHMLPAYTSGYMYYGTSLDMEVKASLACNLATGYADQVISTNPGIDNTPPTVFIPQRYPYNPGGTGFGPTYAYQQHQNSPDFTVWTFAYDVSGLQSVELKYRLDNDGVNPLTDNDNNTYSGGSGVQSWQTLSMAERQFPAGNVTGNPDIDFFIMPDYISDEFYAEIAGLNDTLVDYYVEATDTYGNVFKSPVQHVYIGSNTGGGGSQYEVSWAPENPSADDMITITITDPPTTGKLHWGVNHQGSNWQTPDPVYWPAGTYLFNGSGPAVETPLNGPNPNGDLTLTFGPFNDPAQQILSVAFVIHYDDNSWDNNNGNDYHMIIDQPGIIGVEWEPENPTKFDTIRIFVGQAIIGANLHWGVDQSGIHWQSPIQPYWPPGSFLFNGTGPAVETPFAGPNNNLLSLSLGPFSNPLQMIDGIDFVIHYNDGSWDNNNGNDYYIPISNISGIMLDLKVFLEGPFNGNDMSTELNTNGSIPLSQPYGTYPWYYSGNESVVSIPSNVVDWILIELREASSAVNATSSTTIARQVAFLKNDGYVSDTDGINNPFINIVVSDSLYAVIWHRNHLAVMSSKGLSQTDGTYSHDFSSGGNQVFGGINAHSILAPGVWGMSGGDGNGDKQVNNGDKNDIWIPQAGSGGYRSGDFNLDNQVNNGDKIDIWIPNTGIGSQVPDYLYD
ncbi:MAG: hypothetical protein K8R53_11575 [Bacteroidales bacterium]|nr:hypothetical protein [Bacteroidales bacterium]